MAWLDGERSAELRQQSPITGYIGSNGSGKSLLAVASALTELRKGRRVVSTLRLVDPDGPEVCQDDSCDFKLHPHHGTAHPLWEPLRNWQTLIDAEDCHVLLDEITGVASSRESQALPSEVADRMMQFRRDGVTVAWTAPSWARCDLLLREVTQCAVLARGGLRTKVKGEAWRVSRLITSRMVDARDLDELTQSQRLGTARAPLSTLVRGVQLVSKTEGARFYNTMDSVLSLAQLGTRGACLTCAGTRVRPRCECGSDGGKAAAAPSVRTAASRSASSPVGRRVA